MGEHSLRVNLSAPASNPIYCYTLQYSTRYPLNSSDERVQPRLTS